MGKLMSFEFKKLFMQKKGLFLLVLFLLVIGLFIYGSINSVRSDQYGKEDKVGKEIKAVEVQKKDNPDELKYRYLNLKNAALQDLSEFLQKFDWRGELKCRNNLDKVEMDFLKAQGITDEASFKQYEDEIKENNKWLDSNIQPVNVTNSIKGPFFIVNLFTKMFPFILVIFLLLTVSDSASKEVEDGTHKIMLIQPIKRTKILAAKFITGLIYNFLFFILGVVPVYLLLNSIETFFTGAGSMQYPVAFNENCLSFFKEINPKIIETGVYKELLFIAAGAFVIVFVMTALGILISSVCNNSATSMVSSIVVMLCLYAFENFVTGLSTVKSFMFFTYNNIPSMIDGSAATSMNNAFITLGSGIVVTAATTIILFVASMIIYKKRSFSE